MRVLFIAGKGGADGFNGRAGENGDAVIGLLGDGDGFVAEGRKGEGGKLGGLEFLKQKDVGLLRLEPGGDMGEARADGVDVPGGDPDGSFSRGYCSATSRSMVSLMSSPTICAGYFGAIPKSVRWMVVVAANPA